MGPSASTPTIPLPQMPTDTPGPAPVFGAASPQGKKPGVKSVGSTFMTSPASAVPQGQKPQKQLIGQ